MEDAFTIGFDLSNNEDESIATVIKLKGQSMTVKQFVGKEAEDLYLKLGGDLATTATRGLLFRNKIISYNENYLKGEGLK